MSNKAKIREEARKLNPIDDILLLEMVCADYNERILYEQQGENTGRGKKIKSD